MYPLFKRLADIVASILVLTCFSPIFLILAILLIAVYKESPVFVQERPGLHGKPFLLYKLKSMRYHSEADGSAGTDEQRVTRVGAVLRRLKLDELPQFWNVLKGDMSLVGPRPLLMEYLPLYSVDQMKRISKQPKQKTKIIHTLVRESHRKMYFGTCTRIGRMLTLHQHATSQSRRGIVMTTRLLARAKITAQIRIQNRNARYCNCVIFTIFTYLRY